MDVLDAVDAVNQDGVAYYLMRQAADSELQTWAGLPTGRDLLNQLKAAMTGGIQWPGETAEIERIDLALKSMAPCTPSDAAASVAEQVVDNYKAAPPQEQAPDGLCYEVSRERIEQATQEVLGEELTANLPEKQATDKLEPTEIFDRLWGSLIAPKWKWKSINESYRGKGAPGAMAYAGKAQLVDQGGIWSGDLNPGAVIQTWRQGSDFDEVKKGNAPGSYGHSFIFLEYVRENDQPDGQIIGMKIMDQGFQSGQVLTQGAYEYWVAANITLSREETCF
jgi:hypothetical protein